ncbi:MAG TPA: AI-2E family transporter [Verrucomicrobiae bacterium]|nr:AI-2E family transporter [Verrucomicrobiae bacterium]
MAADQRNLSPKNSTLLAVVVTVAVLYFARVIFIPFALAILVSFLLAPLVIRLRHWRVGRVPSVLLVVCLAFVAMGICAVLMSSQLNDLAHNLPKYQENIQKKIHSVRDSSSGTINKIARTVHEFSEDLTPTVPAKNTPGEEKPVPVEIRRNAFSPLDAVRQILGSVINVFFTAGIVVVFVIFILLQREDLRDRFIRLIGASQINLTTKALDEAAQRVSRYLLAQLALNAGFGVLAGVGLFFIGVPNPVLWGVFAALFRYIPYLGIWLAAAMPAGVALATGPGWWEPVGIFGLYFGIDLLVLNFVEPLLYGSSTGISPLGILIAAIFWTWLWGPIGLLLATPLTVCLVVIGRYVPSLEFMSVLLGDQPVLSADKRFYQRLLAMDIEEATEIAQDFLKERKSLAELYDGVIIPALTLAEEERHRGRLDEERQKFVVENARFLVEEFGERAAELLATQSPSQSQGSSAQTRSVVPVTDPGSCVLCMPARDEADEIGALMLAQLLNATGIPAKSISASLASERLEEVAHREIRLVCISAVPPFGYLHARYLTKRLRAQFPGIKIIVAVLSQGDASDMKKREPQIPADDIVTSLRQALSIAVSLAPCASRDLEPAAVNV